MCMAEAEASTLNPPSAPMVQPSPHTNKPVQQPKQKQVAAAPAKGSPHTEETVQQPKQAEATQEEATTPYVNPHGDFYINIGQIAETDHGDVPKATEDSSEADIPEDERSKDVGFGHKVKASENTSRKIHGITFIDEKGNYVPLTLENKKHILREDMKAELNLSRTIKTRIKDGKKVKVKNWDQKLKEKGSSWDKLGEKYRNVLTSLAYNTGGTVAGDEFDKVLDAAINKDVVDFAKELRRNDDGEKTAGMDNRVLRELYYADLIKNASEVSSVLPLANATQAGVPAGTPKTKREEFQAAFKAAKQKGAKIFEWPKGSGKKYSTKEA